MVDKRVSDNPQQIILPGNGDSLTGGKSILSNSKRHGRLLSTSDGIMCLFAST